VPGAFLLRGRTLFNPEEMQMQTWVTIESPIGELALVNTDGRLSSLDMGTPRSNGRPGGSRTTAGFEQAIEELNGYFAGERDRFTVPLEHRGSEFQLRVWALLREIPYGETRSYGDIARQLGDPARAREVGWANARNPIAIVVPCHRVIGSDGSLTGYAGGLERKRFLLDLEAGRRPLFVP
jgi:methylated-DNA-[protein]-cysteine S-methyltransferase